MGIEVEREYLVRGDSWRAGPAGVKIRQGFFNEDRKARSVRVRIEGDKAYMGIKGPSVGAGRSA
jgi:adenylate cyclase